MPVAKIEKARRIVADAYHRPRLSRKGYRSLLGSLRHVATCIRAARPFLQRLCKRESHLQRFENVHIDSEMQMDLAWWWRILHSDRLNGVPMSHFGSLPAPSHILGMDACDTGLCVIDAKRKRYIIYNFSIAELELIQDFNRGVNNSFDINYRELLSAGFAAAV